MTGGPRPSAAARGGEGEMGYTGPIRSAEPQRAEASSWAASWQKKRKWARNGVREKVKGKVFFF
jgi:hypothetical protein